jgi:hypothetical protein
MDVSKISNIELLLIHGCIRESIELINDVDDFHARVGVDMREAKRVMDITGKELDNRLDSHGNWIK